MSGVVAGTAFYIRDRRMGTHLWVVVTSADPQTGRVVIVPIVTERPHTNKTVQLNVGDHPFIRHASNVDFGSARYANSVTLTERMALADVVRAESFDAPVLSRLQHGLLTSSHTINEIAAYVRDVLGE